MATKRLRMEEAYEYVKSKRKIISPNFNFMGQLLGFETQVFSPGNPSPAKAQSMAEPLSPLLSRMSSSTGFCFESEMSPSVRYRGNSAPSSPSKLRPELRLVFDFSKVPNNPMSSSVKTSHLMDGSLGS